MLIQRLSRSLPIEQADGLWTGHIQGSKTRWQYGGQMILLSSLPFLIGKNTGERSHGSLIFMTSISGELTSSISSKSIHIYK